MEVRLAMDNPFSELFNIHFRAGTGRPPGKAGRAWTVKEFAACAGVDERTVRYWRTGKKLPLDLLAIESFFGLRPSNDTERLDLREEYDAAKRYATDPVLRFINPPEHEARRKRAIEYLTRSLLSPRARALPFTLGTRADMSAVTRAVVTSADMVRRFGMRRWIVKLDTVNTPMELQTAIISAISLDRRVRTFAEALSYLNEAPGLLILDVLLIREQLETTLDLPPPSMRDCLIEIMAGSMARLLISMRGFLGLREPFGGGYSG
jgi:hypothetical protein